MAQEAELGRLLEWATELGASVHPAMRLSQGEAGRGWRVDADTPAGTVLLRVPLSLCIAAPSAEPEERSALWSWRGSVTQGSAMRVAHHLAAVQPPLPQACTLAVLLAYLLSHHQQPAAASRRQAAQPVTRPNLFGIPLPGWLFDAEEEELDPDGGDAPAEELEEERGCGHAPYLSCLPRPGELQLLPCWPDRALAALSCTSLAPNAAAAAERKQRQRPQAMLEPESETEGEVSPHPRHPSLSRRYTPLIGWGVVGRRWRRSCGARCRTR